MPQTRSGTEQRGANAITGARALVEALVAAGVDTVFGTVGHGNLAFVDALVDDDAPRYVSVYHEQVAVHAADAYFRVSGKVAVVTTTVGPGLTNVATGLGDALLDSSALVVIAGGVPTDSVGRELLQELSLHSDDAQPEIFRPLTKRVIRATDASDLPRAFNRALRAATSGCPGPVLLHVPLDLFSAVVERPAITYGAPTPVRTVAERGDIARAVALLGAAERPLIYAGGGAVVAGAGPSIRRLAEQCSIPIATTMSGRGVVSEDHPLVVGFTGVVGTEPANLAARDADLLLAIGTRFPEMDTSSWSASFTQIPPARLIHVDVDPAQFDKVYPADVALAGDARATVEALLAELDATGDPGSWAGWTDRVTTRAREWNAALEPLRTAATTPLEPAFLLHHLRSTLPDDVVFVSGVGIRHAVGQHFAIRSERSHIVASGFGTMGQEVAAPIGAHFGAPDRPVVALVGDGALLACLAALPTAAAANASAVWIVLDNGGYASIAVYQAKHYGRYLGTYFRDATDAPYAVDYVQLAQAFGLRAGRAGDTDELDALVADALAAGGPWVIEVPVTPRPSIQGSGRWEVNDILAGPRERLSKEVPA